MFGIEDLFGAALQLSAKDRARLARVLLTSLAETGDPESEDIEARVSAIDSGEVQLEDWEDVQARINARLKPSGS